VGGGGMTMADDDDDGDVMQVCTLLPVFSSVVLRQVLRKK